jgi:hypothetical protein
MRGEQEAESSTRYLCEGRSSCLVLAEIHDGRENAILYKYWSGKEGNSLCVTLITVRNTVQDFKWKIWNKLEARIYLWYVLC